MICLEKFLALAICLAVLSPARAGESISGTTARRSAGTLAHFESVGARLLGQGGLASNLEALQAEYASLPDGDGRKSAFETVLKAATSNPGAAGIILFNGGLDGASAEAAGLKGRSEALRDFENILAAAQGRQGPALEEAARRWKAAYDGGGAVRTQTAVPADAAGPVPSGAPAAVRRVSRWIFDIDDNLFRLPTKIILFKGGEEKPISSAEFARIRNDFKKEKPQDAVARYAGAEEAYKGFELRGGKEAGSYRNFLGRGFLEDLKWAVENLPKSEWQGPSFGALAYALSQEDAAGRVSFVTMRGNTDILEGIAHLRDLGYLKYLPLNENIRSVYGTPDPSIAKAGFVADAVELADKTPIPPDAPESLDQDGSGYKPLNLVGFSDDDRVNFEAVFKYLAERVRKGAWKNVKITLFYTGPEQPDLKPGAYVITTKGGLRPGRENPRAGAEAAR